MRAMALIFQNFPDRIMQILKWSQRESFPWSSENPRLWAQCFNEAGFFSTCFGHKSPVLFTGPASRLMSPGIRNSSASGITPRGPRRSPWSTATPEKSEKSERPVRPVASPLGPSTRQNSPLPKSVKCSSRASELERFESNQETGETLSFESFEGQTSEATDRIPSDLQVTETQITEAHSAKPGPQEQCEVWQCKAVVELLQPFRESLEAALSSFSTSKADGFAQEKLHDQCKLMVSAATALQKTLESSRPVDPKVLKNFCIIETWRVAM